MNIILNIPEDLQTHIKDRIQSGVYSSAAEYFLDLGQQDRQRQQNRAKIEHLLQESLDSDSELITGRGRDVFHPCLFRAGMKDDTSGFIRLPPFKQ